MHAPASRESSSPASPTTWEIEVFYDGACPLCSREIALLRRWDRQGRIRFTDIAAPGFDAASLGVSQQELMDQIHGRLPDGDWARGVEVFRRMYAAVGFRRLAALSRWPIVRPLLDLGYRFFARYRLRLTGRCNDSCPAKPDA